MPNSIALKRKTKWRSFVANVMNIVLSIRNSTEQTNATVFHFHFNKMVFPQDSATSGLVNKFITVILDPKYYTVEGDKVDVKPAWKLLHQILLNYFEEIETTDVYGGFLQTPWNYKSFNLSEKQIRTRVTVRDITTPERVAFQIKISSEVAGSMAARHGEFTEIDRIPKELEPMIPGITNPYWKSKQFVTMFNFYK